MSVLFIAAPVYADMDTLLDKARKAYAGHNDSLLTIIDAAAKKAISEGDYPAQVELLRLKGIYFFLSGNHARGLDILLGASLLGEQHQVRKELVITYYELGTVYSKNKQVSLARKYIDKGLILARQYGDTAAMADGNNRIGILYENKGVKDSALLYYRIGYELNLRAKDSLGLSYSLENMATVYASLHEFRKSIAYLKQALAIRKAKGDGYGIAIATINISESYREAGQTDSAIHYGHLAVLRGKQVNFPDLLQHTYFHLSGLYKMRGQYDSALYYHEQYAELKDSVFNSEKSRQIAEMSARYETVKKEQQIKVLNKQKTIQRLGLTASVLLLVILGIIVYVLFRNRRMKELQLKQEAAFQLQLQEAEARNAMQQERLRISRELHDNIGAHLTFINATVDEMAGDQSKVKQVKELTNETIRELRKTVWLINRSSITLDEFVLKLRDFLRNIPHLQLSANVPDAGISLSPEVVTELFRCVQEAVNNALKYAHASEINVSIILQGQKELYVEIADDGVGFDPGPATDTGFGLQHMQQRMQLVNGSCTLKTYPGAGTRIILFTPLS
ncbi:tetratricopeptide repeat-containing sensor histidine kinase [Rurimicrobium arvi]|uniref:histidine kinase n=1 Tax=Rurimicrobium arvi TaxID=2049916 RepID=A0ABP8MHT5_9BACT